MLAANKIYKRDCVSGMKDLGPERVDLAFADPPFNIGYEYDVYDDAKETAHYLTWSREWIGGVTRALKPTGTFWLAIGDEYAAELKIIAQEIGFTCRSWVIWYYTFGVNCKQKFSRSHAHLFHFVKDAKKFTFNDKAIRVPSARQLVYADGRANPDGRLPDDTWILRPQDVPDGFRAEDDTWYFPRVAGTFKERAGFHGCQMPEQLLGRIIRCCSEPGDLVLDPFSGSATTLVVAKKLGRNWVGFDLSADYIRRGRARVESALVNAPLEGAPEPLVSAPATPVGKPDTAKTARRTATSTVNMPRAVGTKTAERAKNLNLENAINVERGIVEAFRVSSKGFSVDRVLADDDLNAGFSDQCVRLALPGNIVSWNRAMLRLRKAGKLSAVVTTRRTEFDRNAADSFLFASEIAMRRMADSGKSFDDVLCDPILRQEFDSIARAFSPGFSSLEYRWAALAIRKEASDILKKAALVSDRRLRPPQRIMDLSLNRLRNSPGLYLLQSDKLENKSGGALYAGVTLDLARRLGMVYDGKTLHGAWGEYSRPEQLFVATVPLDPSGHSNWISALRPHQSRIVGKFSPALNSKLLELRASA